jgi:DNA-binding transcriptional ArsR family regulator
LNRLENTLKAHKLLNDFQNCTKIKPKSKSSHSPRANQIEIFSININNNLNKPNFLGAVWMSIRVRQLKYLLGWLIAGTRGGVTRAKIIETLKENPQNANQLANSLEMDYRTIRHHLQILQKNKIITSAGNGYGITYFLSPEMEENYGLFEEIMNKIWKKQKREENK